MASKWSEVVDDPKFSTLPVEQKAILRDEYFNNVVAPTVPEGQRELIKKDFYERTNQSFQRPLEHGGNRTNTQSEVDFPAFAWDRLKSGFSQFAALPPTVMSGINNSVNKTLGTNAAGLTSRNNVDYTKAIKEGLNVKDYPPTTAPQEILKYPLEYAGMGAAPSAGIVARSSTPIRAALTEMGSMFGAGEGQEIGETVGRSIDNTPSGEKGGWEAGLGLGGAFFGGSGLDAMLAPNMLSRAVSSGKDSIKSLWEKVVGHTVGEDEIKQVVGAKLNEFLQADPETSKKLAESLELQKKIPGYNPDLAQATQSQAIVALKESFARKSLDAVKRFDDMSTKNKAAIEQFKAGAFPSAKVLPHQVAGQKVAETVAQHEQRIQALNKQIEDTDKTIRELAAEFPTIERKTPVGSRLHQLSQDLGEMARIRSAEQYRLLGDEADKFGVTIDIGGLDKFVKNSLKSRSEYFREKPESFYLFDKYSNKYLKEDLKSEIPRGEKNISFTEAHELRKRAGRDYRKMDASDPRKEYVKQMMDMLDEQFKRVESVPGFGDKLKAVNEHWKKTFFEPFKQGAGGAMSAEGKMGWKVSREAIHRDLFLSKGEKGAADFISMFGDNPEALEINRSMTLGEFIESAQKGSGFDVKKARDFLEKHKSYLQDFPDIKRDIESVVGFGEHQAEESSRLMDELAQVNNLKKEAGSSALAKIAHTENPQTLVGAALSDPAKARELIDSVRGNPLAEQGLASEVSRYVFMKDDPAAFLSDPELSKPVHAMLANLGEKHWDNLRTIAEGEKSIEFGGRPVFQVRDAIEDPVEKVLGTSTKGLFSRLRGNVMGYTSPGYVVFDIGGKFAFKMKKEAADKFMESVITDPKIASDLAEIYKTQEMRNATAASVVGKAATSAKSKISEIYHELIPHIKMHGIRVSAYNLTKEDDNETRRKDKSSLNARINAGLRSVGATQ